ncbi:MAG: hypothetical protein ACM677_07350, partial [Bacteroides sp.]
AGESHALLSGINRDGAWPDRRFKLIAFSAHPKTACLSARRKETQIVCIPSLKVQHFLLLLANNSNIKKAG